MISLINFIMNECVRVCVLSRRPISLENYHELSPEIGTSYGNVWVSR